MRLLDRERKDACRLRDDLCYSVEGYSQLQSLEQQQAPGTGRNQSEVSTFSAG